MAYHGENACKAWVNFKGNGTVSINQSFNVSSITDSGTGRWYVNFSTNMANDSYSVSYGGYYNTGDSAGSTRPHPRRMGLSTSQCGVIGASNGDSWGDLGQVWVTVHGD